MKIDLYKFDALSYNLAPLIILIGIITLIPLLINADNFVKETVVEDTPVDATEIEAVEESRAYGDIVLDTSTHNALTDMAYTRLIFAGYQLTNISIRYNRVTYTILSDSLTNDDVEKINSFCKSMKTDWLSFGFAVDVAAMVAPKNDPEAVKLYCINGKLDGDYR